MPTYEYECEKCKIRFEISHSIKQPPLEDCPKCKAVKSLERLISEPFMIIDKTPKTLGSIADKNTRKMGKYELEEKQHEHKERRTKAKERAIQETLGTNVLNTSNKKSKLTKDEQHLKKLTKLTKEQQIKYIEKGTL